VKCSNKAPGAGENGNGVYDMILSTELESAYDALSVKIRGKAIEAGVDVSRLGRDLGR